MALTFFGDTETANSSLGGDEKAQRLARLLAGQRVLLILDGVEPLQFAPTSATPGELKDQGIAALLRGLAANSKGLCVVTTRYSIPDLRAFRQTTAPEEKLLRLSREAGVHLIQMLGVRGSLLKTIPMGGSGELVNEFEKLVEDVKGHALTLNLLGTFLRDAHAGDIRQRDLVKLEEANDGQGGHAFHVMDAYVSWFESDGKNGKRALALLRLLGLFEGPATVGCLSALQVLPVIVGLTDGFAGVSEANRNIALRRLTDARLITAIRGPGGVLLALDTHPLLREYFGNLLRAGNPSAWRAAHRRVFEYLCRTTNEGVRPTLSDLQPLYQAMSHGCHAGMQQEVCNKVYKQRITRWDERYAIRKLGAYSSDLGAISCFFEQPWNVPSSALTGDDKSWIIGQAAFRLRALGRLVEAIEPMQIGLEMGVRAKAWSEATIRAKNLSELKLMLGEITEALMNAENSLTYADLDKVDWRSFITSRSVKANALHHAGETSKAEMLYREIDKFQSDHQPDFPLLYSVEGFRYCELLLSRPERSAWHSTFSSSFTPILSLSDICVAVSARADRTLEWAKKSSSDILSAALDQLTKGRASLFAAIVGRTPINSCIAPIARAMEELRCAGTQYYLPNGLLTRAWLRSLENKPTGTESSQSDLDEAWEISERGPMRLHMADIHLYRARLFFREQTYPWKSPQDDLAAAEKLINDCGYHRRDEELADAKSAILGT